MLNDIAKNPHLYKTEIKKNNTIAPDEEEEKGGKNKRGKKTKKRVVDRETELALEEARLEEQKIELEDQTKNRVEQMMKSEAEPNILDAQVLELKSTEIGKSLTQAKHCWNFTDDSYICHYRWSTVMRQIASVLQFWAASIPGVTL